MRILVAALFFSFAAADNGIAQWKLARSEHATAPDELVEHWQTRVENGETGERADLHLAMFETPRATLQVIDQPAPPRRDLAEVMGERKRLAGVNGGYFDPADAPVGLLVSNGQVIAPLRKARLLSGVLTATPTRVDIVRATRFAMSEKIKEAVQCGPLLVENAAPVGGLNDARSARRTFAAVDGRGRAALGFCSDVSLAQLGRILCLTNVAGGMKIARALNLDGGSSSAFWYAGKEGAFSIPEQKTVRDFVAIVPRPNR